MAQTAFDTLDFANKLKAAGLNSKIAETQAELQAILQNNVNERLNTQQTTLNELTKHELATKDDIGRLETKIDLVENKLEAKITMIENKLIVKLGGTMIGCSAALGALATFFHVVH